MKQTSNNVECIRKTFAELYKEKQFTIDARGNKVVEIIGASFLADEPTIFAEVNNEYVAAEIAWYESESTNINDIYKGKREPPKAWQSSADKHGNINSNYGHLVFSQKYFQQYHKVCSELMNNPTSRRATMVYNRPSIWLEYNENGKSDFICTNAVTYYLRDEYLHCVVQMRSNDVWAGYRNDRAWQMYLLEGVAGAIKAKTGNIFWQVQNLHLYERQFYLLDHYAKTGEHAISHEEYKKLYS